MDDIEIGFDWRRASKLEHYTIADHPKYFLTLAVFAKQRPLGTVYTEHGQNVLFRYTEEIHYIDKYIEDYQFSEQEYNEFRESLTAHNRVYYDLLVDEQRVRKSRNEA